jgi:hypothetical protein
VSVALAKVTSWEDHIEAWHHLGREVDGAAWARAAIAASLKGRYGEGAISKFAKEVGFSKTAIYDFARTFEAFPEKSSRPENLSFTHCIYAVSLTDSPRAAREALALAESEGLSANALRKQLRPPETEPKRAAPPPPPPRSPTLEIDPAEFDDPGHVSSLIFDGLRPMDDLYERWPRDLSLRPLINMVRERLNRFEAWEREQEKRRRGNGAV